MGDFSLKEKAEMLTSSLVFGGKKTLEQLKELDWLKTTSEFGIIMYIREAESRGWIETKCCNGEPNIYRSTAKGRKIANERE